MRNLLIALPDAFGTKVFCVMHRNGRRLDRLPPRQRAADPGRRRNHQMVESKVVTQDKLLVFSDAMDVGSIEETITISAAGYGCRRLGHQPHQ